MLPLFHLALPIPAPAVLLAALAALIAREPHPNVESEHDERQLPPKPFPFFGE